MGLGVCVADAHPLVAPPQARQTTQVVDADDQRDDVSIHTERKRHAPYPKAARVGQPHTHQPSVHVEMSALSYDHGGKDRPRMANRTVGDA